MEGNIMPWHLAHSLLGSVSLAPSDKLLESCPFGHILERRGVASAVPITIDKIEVKLDFHIFDVLDFDLLIGCPPDNLRPTPLGSLFEKLGEMTFARTLLRKSFGEAFSHTEPARDDGANLIILDQVRASSH